MQEYEYGHPLYAVKEVGKTDQRGTLIWFKPDDSIFIMHGLISKDSILNAHKTAILLSAIVLVTTVSSMLIAQHPAIRSVGFPHLSVFFLQ